MIRFITATYCMPPALTTCQGMRDTQDVSCTMDSESGVDDVDDGYCPTEGTGAGLCSYECAGGVDCGGGLTCSAASRRRWP